MITSRDARAVGAVGDEARDGLRRTLLHCVSSFDVYARLFDEAGISIGDVLEGEPMEVLRALPIMGPEAFGLLMEESLAVGSQIIDMETSSGTTGPRKRRFISYADDVSETGFLAEMFRVCGVDASDRVACLDTDPLTLMVSFTKALDLLGVEEAYAYCAGNDFDSMLAALPTLDPTLIIAVPSIIERCLGSLKRRYGEASAPSLRRFLYVGEPLSASTRAELVSAFGVEVFGYYGASETSALGIECSAHDGIHLFADRNVFEMLPLDSAAADGEIVVTTLQQETLPLLRYPLRDEIVLRQGECACGRDTGRFPRVDVVGRVGDSVSILGAKISYNGVLRAVYAHAEDVGPMRLVVSREDKERLSVVLPEGLRRDEASMRLSLIRSQPDVDFLVASGYLMLEFSFVEDDFFADGRKARRIVDERS